MARLAPQASLFDAPTTSPIVTAADWITGVLLGELAISLCVLAVAFVGLMMMSGRVPIRTGMRVAIGCFVILGAPQIAAGLLAGWGSPPPPPALAEPPIARRPPPANYDPYAGASVPTDR